MHISEGTFAILSSDEGTWDLCFAADDLKLWTVQRGSKPATAGKVDASKRDIPVIPIDPLPPYISQKENRKVLVIVSNASGKGIAAQFFDESLKPLLDFLKVDYSVSHLSALVGKGSVTDLAQSLDNSCDYTVILLSGDTTLHEFVNGLPAGQANPQERRGQVSFIILPFGSGNALATSITTTYYNDYPGKDSLEIALLALLSPLPTLRPLDAMAVSFPPQSKIVVPNDGGYEDIPSHGSVTNTLFSVVVASWALHAALVAESETLEYRKLGNARFAKAAADLLRQNLEWQGKIEYELADKSVIQSIQGPHSYVLLALVSDLEPGFTISPETKALSSPPYLVQIDKLSSDDIMSLLKRAYNNGDHIRDKRVRYQPVSKATVTIHNVEEHLATNHDFNCWCVDGRIVRAGDGSVNMTYMSNNILGFSLNIVLL